MTEPAAAAPATTRWGRALATYGRPRIAAMFALGFSAGLPFLLVFTTLTAWLTEAGVARSAIGFFSWVGITYSIKVFWSPIVDKVRLPILGRLLGQRRSWILLAQALIILGLAGMAFTDPAQDLVRMALFALVVAFGSATQDIAIDAWRIEAAPVEEQAAMSATYVFGYRIALDHARRDQQPAVPDPDRRRRRPGPADLVISGENFAQGFLGTAAVAYLSALVNQRYTATQYALFSSLIHLPGKVLGAFSGGIVEAIGYGPYFVITTVIIVPALALYFWLRPRVKLGGDDATDEPPPEPGAARAEA
jgi:MFS family permease